MKTAIKLCEYDDILNPRYIYSLLCLAALKNKFYGICSKAFVKVTRVCLQLVAFESIDKVTRIISPDLKCSDLMHYLPLYINSLHYYLISHYYLKSAAGDASFSVGGGQGRHPDAGCADIHQELAHGPRRAAGALHQVPGGRAHLQGLRNLRKVRKLCGWWLR